MAMSLENAQLHHDLLEKERLEREMAMARGIQRSLLPETSPVIPGFDIAVLNEPCFEVGGDYYDFLSLGPNTLLVVIADVEGKAQILGADVEFFRQVFHADAFGDRDFARDGHRLSAVLHAAIAWRRHKALHRAFFGLGVLLLASATAARGGALRARSFASGRCAAGAGACHRSRDGARQILGARQSRAALRERPAAGVKPPVVERVGCLGRGPPAN